MLLYHGVIRCSLAILYRIRILSPLVTLWLRLTVNRSSQKNNVKNGEDYHTKSLIDNDTVPSDATVSRGDTVFPCDTVSYQDTVTSSDPVFSPDSQFSSVTTKSCHSTDLTNNFFKMDADVYDVLAKFQTPFREGCLFVSL